jgi:hypothetical protein
VNAEEYAKLSEKQISKDYGDFVPCTRLDAAIGNFESPTWNISSNTQLRMNHSESVITYVPSVANIPVGQLV